MTFFYVAKNICRIGMKAYFKNIYFTGAENIPHDKPVIFAANHTNGLLDPVAIGCHLPYPTHFITRGDIFVPATEKIFKMLNMMPIYRIRDGYHLLPKNEETFKRSFELLKNNQKIIIFSEGDCACEKRLRPLKKGTARMAFQAYEEYGVDAYIVPVSINYTAHTQFRGDVMLHFNTPFKTSDFDEIRQQNKARAIRAFNAKLKDALLEHLVHLENTEHRELLENILAVTRSQISEKLLPILKTNSKAKLNEDLAAAHFINQEEEKDSEELNIINEKTQRYAHLLKKHKIDNLAVGKKVISY